MYWKMFLLQGVDKSNPEQWRWYSKVHKLKDMEMAIFVSHQLRTIFDIYVLRIKEVGELIVGGPNETLV